MRTVARALCALVLLAGCARAADGFGELTVDQVDAKRKEKNVFVYDCNDLGTWRAGHVPGAKLLDYTGYTEKDLPADKNATLVFYCANEH